MSFSDHYIRLSKQREATFTHSLNIITPDHILAYVDGNLPAAQRQDVEAAVRDDDRAATALRAALEMKAFWEKGDFGGDANARRRLFADAVARERDAGR